MLHFSFKKFWAELNVYFNDRFRERSTYLGLISIATSVGMSLSPAGAQFIISVMGAILGAVLIATADDKKPPKE